MPLWDEYLRTSHFNLELVKDPDVGQLSRYEIETLQDAARRHADDDEWELNRLTHEFPEWKKNNPGTSSRPIPAAEKNHMESLLGR
jgi:hypothetical protein